MTKKKEISFEGSLQRLQEISDILEKGEIGLEESIKIYEEGINLANYCYKTLETAELKVTDLKKQLEVKVKQK
ncbi:MAG: exodeoxyribonuclease VII small subunit [Ignavibacteria bacterium]|nr:exodeoxyribonuclease VII small subunit [Ignavibacteria bacterium]